jgi:ribosomal protein S12 methylthiotransferase accessory factor
MLPVRLDGGTVLVGPLLFHGAPACLACVEFERLAAISGKTPRDEQLSLGGVLLPTTLPMLQAVIRCVVEDPEGSSGVLWAIRAQDGTCSTHPVRPRRGGCRTCGPLPQDRPAAAGFAPAARPLPDPFRLRQPNPATTVEALRDVLHDLRLGPVVRTYRNGGLPLAVAGANVSGLGDDGGYGRATTFADADRIALFEAAERLAGRIPLGRRTTLYGSYQQLGPDHAVDPARLGLHEPRYYDHPRFRLTPYAPDVPTHWVHGWSMAEGRTLAVPEHVAYWGPVGQAHEQTSPRFVYESSNGCGLGNSLEEAILYGLFEVAERDAFLMAWYARTPLGRVAVPPEDALVVHLADTLDVLGYELMLFDATNDFGIPVVLTLVLHRDPTSPAPHALFAAGAHPDPREAIRSAAIEVAVNVFSMTDLARRDPAQLDRGRLLAMLSEPELVQTLDDHMTLHTLAEARGRYDFLLSGAGEPRPWHEVWPDQPRPVADLGEFLTDLAGRLARESMDVIVVDQSFPAIRDRLGLHAAKVIVPGALPMTFGHLHRRTRGVPRLLEVPWRLGRLPECLDYDELPFDPHSFP